MSTAKRKNFDIQPARRKKDAAPFVLSRKIAAPRARSVHKPAATAGIAHVPNAEPAAFAKRKQSHIISASE